MRDVKTWIKMDKSNLLTFIFSTSVLTVIILVIVTLAIVVGKYKMTKVEEILKIKSKLSGFEKLLKRLPGPINWPGIKGKDKNVSYSDAATITVPKEMLEMQEQTNRAYEGTEEQNEIENVV